MLLTSEQIADKLQVTTETIYRWRKEGMPYHQLSVRTFRYDLDAVMTWKSNRVDARRTLSENKE